MGLRIYPADVRNPEARLSWAPYNKLPDATQVGSVVHATIRANITNIPQPFNELHVRVITYVRRGRDYPTQAARELGFSITGDETTIYKDPHDDDRAALNFVNLTRTGEVSFDIKTRFPFRGSATVQVTVQFKMVEYNGMGRTVAVGEIRSAEQGVMVN